MGDDVLPDGIGLSLAGAAKESCGNAIKVSTKKIAILLNNEQAPPNKRPFKLGLTIIYDKLPDIMRTLHVGRATIKGLLFVV